MKKLLLCSLFVLCLPPIALAQVGSDQVTLSYYLPDNHTYDPAIPTPESVVGHEVGQWHITHDKLVKYLEVLASVSDRFHLENRGTTFEGRPLLLLTVTSPENHKRIDAIAAERKQLIRGEIEPSSDMPIVIYQGFSIHGNEPSGSNAALAYAYHLAASNEVIEDLKNTVILFDPSFNPDGLQRFASWANVHRAHQLNYDPNDREYREAWPGGRTNHYWFDLNRDWLPVQLPESRARIVSYHKWLPNILTDHHEMGTNSTFFFQPGEPSRVHPLTPKINQELTKKIGSYHAKALDQIGSLYYSEENYDDYYYGKGSTFPDLNGSVGILFEQGSSRGHGQESENGTLTFPFTIKNQFTTALSTLEAANALRSELIKYQYEYYQSLQKEAIAHKTSGYLFGTEKDASSAWHLTEILKRHGLEVHELTSDYTTTGKTYAASKSYFVPLKQQNPRLVEAIFEERTTFTDSLFYDISAWTFPHAFGLQYQKLAKAPNTALQEVAETPKLPQGSIGEKSSYAYLLEWHDYYAPKALHQITSKGIRVKVALRPFELEGKSYDYGTLVVPLQNQQERQDEIYKLLSEIAENHPLEIHSVSTGLTRGIDLGSNELDPVKPLSVALLVGDGISSYDAGEIWHLFDQRYGIQLTKLEASRVSSADLTRYSDIIIPSFGYGPNPLGEKAAEQLKNWVKSGGTLIGFRSALNWLNNNDLLNFETRKASVAPAKNLLFKDSENYYGAQVTGGAIFEAEIDRSHPINFGYTSDKIALFRNTNLFIEPRTNSFENPIRYSNSPLLSGYISEENVKVLSGSSAISIRSIGRGKVIGFTDNTNFRAFWYGTNRLLMNALFFGDSM
jgi:hypothetical protein